MNLFLMDFQFKSIRNTLKTDFCVEILPTCQIFLKNFEKF